ncbi:phospholipid scramblase 1-like protein, partial [Dinothrombium tinctorium]
LEVFAPPGTPIGYVNQKCTVCIPNFAIKNAAKETVLIIKGPCITSRCCTAVKFSVYTKDENVVIGEISKYWGGIFKEAFSKADTFGISFPMDLDVNSKATLLGALFLIDFMFFESQPATGVDVAAGILARP